MTKRVDIMRKNEIVAFYQDATIYKIDSNGYAVEHGPCEDDNKSIMEAYLALCDSNVPRSSISVQLVNRWMT